MVVHGANHDTSHLFVFTGLASNKAGVAADRRMVADFVYERSKNSQYTLHQRELDARQQARSEATVRRLGALEARMSDAERAAELRRAAARLAALESCRSLGRTFCVVDMDAFYAAVEIRDRPHLRQKPVAVGSPGMVSTANYVARLYGVRSAMPGFIAQEMVRRPGLVGARMPPDELVLVPPDFAKYRQAAEETRAVLREYDAEMRAHTLDEAYLDLTAYLQASGADPETVVAEMRRRVTERTGLTCSAGIGPNPMLAKIASDDQKPDGQSRVLPTVQAVLEYIEHLPLRRVAGVGKVLERQLKLMLEVSTCGELRRAAARVLRAFEGRKTRDFLLRISLGLSGEEVNEEEGTEIGEVGRKSLSSERTFSAKTSPDDLRSQLHDLCLAVAEEMASSVPPLAAKSLSLKMKTCSFEVKTCSFVSQHFIGFPSSDCAPVERGNGARSEDLAGGEPPASVDPGVASVASGLYRALLPLLEEQMPCSLRLMGVRVSQFRSARQVLQRGQQQLGRFFQGPVARDAGAQAALVAKPTASAGFVVDIVDSEGEEDDDVPGVVTCPLCGLRVPVPEADLHVNAHYDTPAPPRATRPLRTARKRKAQQAEVGISRFLRRAAKGSAEE